MLVYWISLLLSNVDLIMFIVAVIAMLINVSVSAEKTSVYEIIYRWTALLALGVTGLYAFFMHTFFPSLTAENIGWLPSPFQLEVAMANLAFGVMGILSFNASYGFRCATVMGSTCWLWGDAVGHLYQLIQYQNYSIGNAGSWFWMDMMVPIILIICIVKLNPNNWM